MAWFGFDDVIRGRVEHSVFAGSTNEGREVMAAF